MTISGKDILFAHHGLEVMVTKPVSRCALAVSGVTALAYHAYQVYYYLPPLVNQVVKGKFIIKQSKEPEIMGKIHALISRGLSLSLHLALFFCVLLILYFLWHVRSFKAAPISKRAQQFLELVVKEAVDELRVLKQKINRFFSLQTLATLGVSIDRFVAMHPVEPAPNCLLRFCCLHSLRHQIIFNPLTKHRRTDKCGYFDFVCLQLTETHGLAGRVTTISLGAILVLALVIMMCMRYRAARILQRRLQETM